MRDPADERPPEDPPERVRSTPGASGSGPVPVRDLMKPAAPDVETPPEADEDPRWDGVEHGFDLDDESWIVRSAGAGAYGTGRLGTARLVAVHFYRATAPDTPVREALLPAGVFPHLAPEELREVFERATPIEVERPGPSG